MKQVGKGDYYIARNFVFIQLTCRIFMGKYILGRPTGSGLGPVVGISFSGDDLLGSVSRELVTFGTGGISVKIELCFHRLSVCSPSAIMSCHVGCRSRGTLWTCAIQARLCAPVMASLTVH
jgi:hypothetical protein